MKQLVLIAFLFIVFFMGCVNNSEHGAFSNISAQNLTEENISTVNNQDMNDKCSDETPNGQCSTNNSFYCKNGSLVVAVDICGYAGDTSQCDQYKTGPKTISYVYYTPYTGQKNIFFTYYKGLNDYLASLPKSLYYNIGEPEPTKRDFIIRDLNNTCQREALLPLITEIKNITGNPTEQAKIAIDIVQKEIIYDFGGTTVPNPTDKYPYEVLYTRKGICGDKSKLLAFMLRELNFGVALFDFDSENHRAVGIKCPLEPLDHSYHKTGYCFIESTVPTLLWDKGIFYFGLPYGEPTSEPEVIPISDGEEFTGV